MRHFTECVLSSFLNQIQTGLGIVASVLYSVYINLFQKKRIDDGCVLVLRSLVIVFEECCNDE